MSSWCEASNDHSIDDVRTHSQSVPGTKSHNLLFSLAPQSNYVCSAALSHQREPVCVCITLFEIQKSWPSAAATGSDRCDQTGTRVSQTGKQVRGRRRNGGMRTKRRHDWWRVNHYYYYWWRTMAAMMCSGIKELGEFSRIDLNKNQSHEESWSMTNEYTWNRHVNNHRRAGSGQEVHVCMSWGVMAARRRWCHEHLGTGCKYNRAAFSRNYFRSQSDVFKLLLYSEQNLETQKILVYIRNHKDNK